MNRKFKLITTPSNNNISIVSWNILAQSLWNDKQNSIPCWSKRWKQIKELIIDVNSDIICLQEVENNVFLKLLECLTKKGYLGFFTPREPVKKKLSNRDNADGVAIFYKSARLRIISSNTINYKELCKKYDKKAYQRFAGLCLELEDLFCYKRFKIANVHLVNKYQLDDIKNLQMYLSKKYMDSITDNKQPCVICGDFNSKPTSAAYHGITIGKSSSKFDFEDVKPIIPIIKTPLVFTKNPMISCYKKVLGKELKYSNYAPNFKNTLDYIFVNNMINVHGVLLPPSLAYLKKQKYLPSKEFPSDHILLMSLISFI